ncbi:unnamed protein product [Clonostachys rhizophaga]|uniref:Chalcone isomerase N-terminal domain-containing protein n=1 Tax=Clonostachys rhizophaga TaxID=160324 RepID=A0A9N9W069_9HYPO|nr:unnamed protein product [Clonostachys rhizophaga]
MSATFHPMRSLIYVSCENEDYRHKVLHWLYKTHIPESIAQFEPYVTKYSFYNALPVPKDGERFGTCNLQLTEHYFLIHAGEAAKQIKALGETMTPDILKGLGVIPGELDVSTLTADDMRAFFTQNLKSPFTQAFVPVWWESDLKGAGRTIEHGANYRWQFLIKYPDCTDVEEADTWFTGKALPAFVSMPETTRVLTSKLLRDVNNSPYHRVVEIWFDSPSDWRRAAIEQTAKLLTRPSWAQTDVFPYVHPNEGILGIFLSDFPTTDNLSQYRGYLTMR